MEVMWAFDRHQLALEVVVVVVAAVPPVIHRGECFKLVTRKKAAKVVLRFQVRQLQRAWRYGRGKVVIPVIIVYTWSAGSTKEYY